MNESEMIPKKFGIFTLAFTYIGTIIGAGFASGTQELQYFSNHGKSGSFLVRLGNQDVLEL